MVWPIMVCRAREPRFVLRAAMLGCEQRQVNEGEGVQVCSQTMERRAPSPVAFHLGPNPDHTVSSRPCPRPLLLVSRGSTGCAAWLAYSCSRRTAMTRGWAATPATPVSSKYRNSSARCPHHFFFFLPEYRSP